MASGSWCRVDLREAVLERDGRTCVYCGAVDDLTLDHVVPRVCGGSNGYPNLVTACRSCNSAKGDRTLVDFAGPDLAQAVRLKSKRRFDRIRRELVLKQRISEAVEAEISRQIAAGLLARTGDSVPF